MWILISCELKNTSDSQHFNEQGSKWHHSTEAKITMTTILVNTEITII